MYNFLILDTTLSTNAILGGIKPGDYEGNEIVEVLRQHSDNPEAIRFIADMLEE